jgi:hypothetical protein
MCATEIHFCCDTLGGCTRKRRAMQQRACPDFEGSSLINTRLLLHTVDFKGKTVLNQATYSDNLGDSQVTIA